MADSFALFAVLTIVLFVCGLMYKPTRKALGVILCFIGFIECIGCVGLIVGLPTMFVGLVLLFI